MNRLCISTLLLAAVLAAIPPAVALATTNQLYRITNLGAIGDVGTSEALAINDLGHVTGWSSATDSSKSTAFYWTPQAGIVDLGIPATHDYAVGVGINNLDQIAISTSKKKNGLQEGHAFRWTAGAYQDLGTLGGSVSYAVGIDDLGRIAGGAETAVSPNFVHAFRSTPETHLIDINGIGGNYSRVIGMNAAGHVVGHASGPDDKLHGFYWPGSGAMQDLGLFGGFQSYASAISDSGIIVGGNDVGEFIWDDGVAISISSPGFSYIRATAVNNSRQVIGQYVTAQNFSRPMIWNASDGATDLNALLDPTSAAGWVVLYANDMNNLGQIVGHGYYNGKPRAFLMSPVPEPSALLLLASSIAHGVLISRRSLLVVS